MRLSGAAIATVLVAGLAGCATVPSESLPQADLGSQAYFDLVDKGFTGDFAVTQPGELDTIYYGDFDEVDASSHVLEGWPWASVTKQVIAVLVMREVEDGRLALDSDVGEFVPRLRGRGLTIEDLLRHRSDLPNPDNTPLDASGSPAFYSDAADPLRYCTSGTGEAREDGSWAYNNCDYIVLGAVLETLADSSIDLLLAQGIGQDSAWSKTGFLHREDDRQFVGSDPETIRRIAGYGTSAALIGPLDDMLRFDTALMDGTLLGPEALATLWNGDPATGYMALGQWVFEAPLAGCDAPVRIVERRGGIGKYQIRNIILPESRIAVAIATDQPDFDFGEIWTGSGASYDLLSTLACGESE